jgi:hypothetical protein
VTEPAVRFRNTAVNGSDATAMLPRRLRMFFEGWPIKLVTGPARA